MNLLSIDTTAEICSIAILCERGSFVFHEERPRQHANILLQEIKTLLLQAELAVQDIELIVFGRGPGSFTGVRIATSFAQGLSLAIGCKVVPISTLQSLAWSAAKNGYKDIWSSLDARMSEVYFARYRVNDQGVPELVSPEQVIEPKNITIIPQQDTFFVGSGWLTDYEKSSSLASIPLPVESMQRMPHALDSAELALQLMKDNLIQPCLPENAEPIYLRDNVTWDNKPKIGS